MRSRTQGLQLLCMISRHCFFSIGLLFSAVDTLGSDDAHVFDSERLMEISIQLSQDDWKSLRTQTPKGPNHPNKQGIKPPHYTYFKADLTIDGVTISSVGIRKKGGFGSVVSTRPSFKVKFNEFVKGQDFTGLSHLTLNNNNQDPSRVHQLLAYKVFRDAGVIAPRCNLARILVNGEDLGVYSNVESIKKPFLKRHFSESDGHLYEGKNSDFKRKENTFERKNNKTDVHRPDLSDMIEIMESGDAELLKRLKERLDIDAFMRFWATEVLIGHWDGYTLQRNNFYLYHHPDSKRYYFIPWGVDSAFGDTNPIRPDTTLASAYAGSVLSQRLYEHPESQAKYRSVISSILDEAWNEDELLSCVDRAEKLISDHVILPKDRFSSSLNKVRNYIAAKRQIVLEELKQDPAPAYPQKQPSTHWLRKSVLLHGTFDTNWSDSNPLNPGNGDAQFKLSVDGEEIELTEIGASAGLSLESLRPDYPSIRLYGQRQDNGSVLVANLAIDPFQWKPNVSLPIDLVRINGTILEAPNGNGPEPFRLRAMLRGTLKLKNAGQTQGQAVSGIIEAHWP